MVGPKKIDLSQPSTALKLGQLRESARAKEQARNISTKEASLKVSSPLDPRLMDRLWIRMAEIFGHKWTSQYGSDPLDTWANRLGSLSAEEIAFGVNACAGSKLQWPPSLPDFCGLCQPNAEDYGLPDVTTAFLEAMRFSHAPDDYIFTHEAVKTAGAAVGWYDMQRCIPSEDSLRQRFKSAYGALVGKVQRGESLDAPLQSIGSDRDKDPALLANEEAEQKLNERIRDQGLHGKTAEQLRSEMLAKFRINRNSAQGGGK